MARHTVTSKEYPHRFWVGFLIAFGVGMIMWFLMALAVAWYLLV